jgi:hypothetical protein
MVEARLQLEENQRQIEQWDREWEELDRLRRKTPAQVRARFQDFVCENADEMMDLVVKMYSHYLPEHLWTHSRPLH